MSKKAMKLVLEALERYQVKRQDFERFSDVITALEEALANQEQGEPVAIVCSKGPKFHHVAILTDSGKQLEDGTKLYTTPQQRKPLRDADYVNACMSYRHDFGLMTQEQRDKLLFTAKEWARAFGMNEATHSIEPQGSDK